MANRRKRQKQKQQRGRWQTEARAKATARTKVRTDAQRQSATAKQSSLVTPASVAGADAHEETARDKILTKPVRVFFTIGKLHMSAQSKVRTVTSGPTHVVYDKDAD